jgi:hypothetical protein
MVPLPTAWLDRVSTFLAQRAHHTTTGEERSHVEREAVDVVAAQPPARDGCVDEPRVQCIE